MRLVVELALNNPGQGRIRIEAACCIERLDGKDDEPKLKVVLIGAKHFVAHDIRANLWKIVDSFNEIRESALLVFRKSVDYLPIKRQHLR